MILVICLCSVLFTGNAYAKELSPEEVRDKAYVHYRDGVNAYNKENYDEALQQLQKALQYHPSKKATKLVDEIRKKGKSYYETGTALVNFNKEMAIKYLQKALPLIDPADDKTIENINSLLQQNK